MQTIMDEHCHMDQAQAVCQYVPGVVCARDVMVHCRNNTVPCMSALPALKALPYASYLGHPKGNPDIVILCLILYMAKPLPWARILLEKNAKGGGACAYQGFHEGETRSDLGRLYNEKDQPQLF